MSRARISESVSNFRGRNISSEIAETAIDDRNGFSFTWKIENFSLCSLKIGQFITSPVFTIETFRDTKWYLKIFPAKKDEMCKQSTLLYLCRCKDDLFENQIEIQFSLKVIDGNDNTFINDAFPQTYVFENGSMQFVCALTDKIRGDLLNWKEDTLTVICTMAYKRKQLSCHAHTKLHADYCSFYLKVPLTAVCTEKKFAFSKLSRYVIKAAVQNEDIKIEVCKQSEKYLLSRRISARISLVNLERDNIHFQRAVHEFESSNANQVWSFPFSITKKQLKDGDFLKNNTLTFFCEFSASTKTELSIENPTFTNHNSLLALHDDLHYMFTNKRFCDVRLRAENETMPAHKSLLTSRSPVFAAMFNQDMVENKLGVIDISDIRAKTLASFLEFIYSGTVKIENFKSALRLLMAADKYQVHSLKEVCCSYLSKAVSIENACEILHVADLVSHERLKQSVLEFIATHMSEVFSSAQWSKWIENNGALLNEVIKHMAGDFEITRKKRRRIILDRVKD